MNDFEMYPPRPPIPTEFTLSWQELRTRHTLIRVVIVRRARYLLLDGGLWDILSECEERVHFQALPPADHAYLQGEISEMLVHLTRDELDARGFSRPG